MLDTEKKISMDGQEIPILWKYIFNLENRLDKLEQILVIDVNEENNRDKAESDSKELTETELAKVLDNLVPVKPTVKRDSLLDKSWEKPKSVKDITPTIKIDDLKPEQEYLDKIEQDARQVLDQNQQKEQGFVDRLKNARQELVDLRKEKDHQDTIAADIRGETNYYRGYVIPNYDKKRKIVVPPIQTPNDEYFLSKEYQELRQAKLSLQTRCEFSGQTAQHVMHKHYNNLGSETPEDMWSLCSWHYKEVIGKQPQGDPPFPIHFILISPNNYIFQIERLSTFSKANGLHASSLSDVATGRNRHHKGWKCYRYKDYQRVLDHLNKTNKKISDGTLAAKGYPSIREINEGEKKSNESKIISKKLN